MSPIPLSSDMALKRRVLDLAKGARGHVWPQTPMGAGG